MAENSLLTVAREMGYGGAELARRSGLPRSYLCDVEKGRKRLSPEAAALIAEAIGLDPVNALKAQTVANERDEGRRERLRKALFTCWAVGVALALALPVNSDALSSAPDRLTLYSLWFVWAASLGASLLRRDRALSLRPCYA